MRVTNNMLINNLIYNVSNNLEKMSQKQDELATGKRIQRPSDDPVLASKVIKYKTDLSELAQYSRNTSDALSWLETTETAISDLGSVLQRARELSVQAANGTNTKEETAKIKSEFEQLKKVVVADSNFSFAGRYVFSFYHTDMPLLKEDGTYNIDITDYESNNKPKTVYEIGIGETIEIDTNGLDLLNYDKSNYITDNLFKNGTANVANGDGTAATKSVLSASLQMNQNYTAGMSITIGGTTYTVNTGATPTRPSLNGTTTPIKTSDMISAIQEADDGGGAKLSTVADVYVDASGKFVVKPKAYGPLTVSMTEPTGATTSVVAGKNQTAAEITSPVLTSPPVVPPAVDDFANGAFNGKEYMVTFNEKTVKITLDTPIGNIGQLQTSLQNKISAAFPAGPPGVTVGVNIVGGGGDQIQIAMAQNPPVNDGSKNLMTVRPITAKVPQLIKDFDDMITALSNDDKAGITKFLGDVDKHVNNVVTQRADIGARTNRLQLVTNRIAENSVTFTRLLSDAQDADMAEVIMYLKNAENVYKSSLSAGARVIQPTLVDFLR